MQAFYTFTARLLSQGVTMTGLLKQRALGVLHALPDAFCLLPRTDYAHGLSSNAEELMLKAWDRTNRQMNQAFHSFELEHADVVEKVAQKQVASATRTDA